MLIYYLIASVLLMLHATLITAVVSYRKSNLNQTQRNLIAIYGLYLIIMLSYMMNNFFWNFLNPSVWIDKFVWVFINPIDNVSALITAFVIRSIFGELKSV